MQSTSIIHKNIDISSKIGSFGIIGRTGGFILKFLFLRFTKEFHKLTKILEWVLEIIPQME